MPTIKFIRERYGLAQIEVDGEPFNITMFRVGDDIDAAGNKATANETAEQAISRWATAAFGAPPAPEPNPDVELADAIAAVVTTGIADPAAKRAIDELKAALLGSNSQGKVKGRPV